MFTVKKWSCEITTRYTSLTHTETLSKLDFIAFMPTDSEQEAMTKHVK